MANTDPTNGESPLTVAPEYGGAGGGDQAAQYYAYRDFQQQFGRAPTQSELAMLSPSYVGGNPNVANLSAGKGGIAAYYQSLTNTPTNISANLQKQALDAYNKNKGQTDAQTNQIFQSSVGRDATPDEAAHFGSLLASGQIDTYGMQQLLGQSQEAQQRQTQTYQDQLSKNLQSTQGDYFKNYIEPSILSQTASAGRDPNSSGVQNAEVQAGKQQNYDLQNYLAQFGAGQYGQSAQNQQNVYQQYLGQQYGLENAGISQQLGQQNYMQQRNTDLANYQMQQQSYQNFLNQNGKRGSGIGGAISGALSGAAAGGSIGGPWGALAGAVGGGALGYYGGTQGNSSLGANTASAGMNVYGSMNKNSNVMRYPGSTIGNGNYSSSGSGSSNYANV